LTRDANARGLAVWALVGNNFDPDLTRSVLSSSGRREKVIRQLLAYTHLLDLDGLNIDFENMYRADGRLFVQFLRELIPLAHAQGLAVSVDVSVPSESDNWSRVYDRRAIAQTVDYVALMAYDEHWAGSPVAGSVASLPWTEAAIQATLSEGVPREKLLLGLPFYTRLWEEHALPSGGVKVKSTAFSLPGTRAFIQQNSLLPKLDPASRQNFVILSAGSSTLKVWLEDEHSLRKRLALVKKYQLAGVAGSIGWPARRYPPADLVWNELGYLGAGQAHVSVRSTVVHQNLVFIFQDFLVAPGHSPTGEDHVGHPGAAALADLMLSFGRKNGIG
jgi:spore germination protein YaaH